MTLRERAGSYFPKQLVGVGRCWALSVTNVILLRTYKCFSLPREKNPDVQSLKHRPGDGGPGYRTSSDSYVGFRSATDSCNSA